jgi:hypothetical protein
MEAEYAYRELTQMFPLRATSWFILGDLLTLKNRPTEALPCFRKAMLLDRTNSLYYERIADCLLRMGELPAGFAMGAAIQAFEPLWDPNSLNGQSVVINVERHWGGLGDVIMLGRYVPLLKERGAGRVLMHIEDEKYRRLSGVITSIPGLDEVCNRPPQADLSAPIFSLPVLFKTDAGTIPAKLPYLFASQSEIDLIQSHSCACGFRVGLCWQASIEPSRDLACRSMASQFLSPLMNIPGISTFNLQGGVARTDRFPGSESMRDVDGVGGSLQSMAALISQLDLVITVDTMCAHLSGALGVTTWVILPYCAEWRWELERETSPWYPGVMKLFRQERPGDWAGVIDRVRRELISKASQEKPRQLVAVGASQD